MASIFPQLTGNTVGELAGPADAASAMHPRYPADLGSPPHEKWILFEVRTGRHVARDGFAAESATSLDRTIASVALYLPGDALKSTTTVTWQEEEYGAAAGAAMEAAFQRGGAINAPTTAGGGSASGDVGRVVAKGAAAGAVAGGKQAAYNTAADQIKQLAEKAKQDNVNVDAIVSGATGKTINPRTDILFKNVGYRDHSFSFKLLPRTRKEAEAIDNILNIFQYYSLPDYGQGSANFFIGYPYEFLITFFTQQADGSTHHLNTIGRSVLETLTVDHAGGGRVAFVDEAGKQEFFPAVTSVEMTFKETRLLGRDQASAVWRGTKNKLPSQLVANDVRLSSNDS